MRIDGTEANAISYCIFVQTREPLAILTNTLREGITNKGCSLII